MIRTMVFRTVALLTVVTLSACSARTMAEPRGDANELTQQQIIASNASDLHQAIKQLRPRWLDVRAPRSLNSDTNVLVFQGRTLVGGLETLRQFDTKSVVSVRYLDSAQAQTQLNVPRSGVHVEGAIVIQLVAGR